MPTLTAPNRLITDWLTDQAEIVSIEKSTDGKVSIRDIQDSLAEYQGLFKAGYASPAMILTLHRAYPDSALYKEVVEERGLLKEDPMVVGGPASVEMIDHEGHLITAAALSKAYDKYMENPMTRNVMVMHSDIQVGWALPAYIGRNGQVFKGGMNDKTLFFISELRKDTKISKKVTEQINKSKMRSYSIAGSAIKTENVAGNIVKGESPYMRVDELELAEVTICEKGVNQGAGFDLIKGHQHIGTCADGSCLITKSPDVKPLQTTETMTFADYKDLLNNDNKDTKSFVQMFKEYTDLQKSDDEPKTPWKPGQKVEMKWRVNKKGTDTVTDVKKTADIIEDAFADLTKEDMELLEKGLRQKLKDAKKKLSGSGARKPQTTAEKIEFAQANRKKKSGEGSRPDVSSKLKGTKESGKVGRGISSLLRGAKKVGSKLDQREAAPGAIKRAGKAAGSAAKAGASATSAKAKATGTEAKRRGSNVASAAKGAKSTPAKPTFSSPNMSASKKDAPKAATKVVASPSSSGGTKVDKFGNKSAVQKAVWEAFGVEPK